LTGSGGAARLTEEGEETIALFWKFYEDFQKFLARGTKILAVLNKGKNKEET
jgi:molybdenum-dependent DNA-binding transcriptional regulator ModE